MFFFHLEQVGSPEGSAMTMLYVRKELFHYQSHPRLMMCDTSPTACKAFKNREESFHMFHVGWVVFRTDGKEGTDFSIIVVKEGRGLQKYRITVPNKIVVH
jgi:hypothetical protein